MSLKTNRTQLIWFILPLIAISGIYLASGLLFQHPAPGTILEQGKGYSGIRESDRIDYDFTDGHQQVDKSLTELLALSSLEPSEYSRIQREATYSQPLDEETPRRSWFRPELPKEVSWPYTEILISAPATETGSLVFDYQRMLESKLWTSGAEVISEELVEITDSQVRKWDKLAGLMAEAGTQKVVGLTLEVGFNATVGGHDVTVVTHKITFVQPWVESYVQRFPGQVKPKIALIMDDWGYDHPQAVETMMNLPYQLDMAVIPGLSKSWEQALIGYSRGWEVMLHLPMEPQSQWRLGEYAIKTDMSDAQIRDTLQRAMEAVPALSGVNNHMGSKATTDMRVMRVVLDEVSKSGLFFVDSRTSGRSIVPQAASDLGVPYAQNQVFLDNEDDIEYILGRLELLVETAKRQGQVVGIGHLRLNTAKALDQFFRSPEFQEVQLVPASELVSR